MGTPIEVMNRLGRMAKNIPEHIATAFEPNLYEEHFRSAAAVILENADFLTDSEKTIEIPMLIRSIAVEKGDVDNSLVFKMGGLEIFSTEVPTNLDAIATPTLTPEKIREWVERGKLGDNMGKHLKERDMGTDGEWQSTEEIANRVFFAMRRNPEAFFGFDEPGKKSLDPTGIAAFAGFTRLKPETIEKCLMLVLSHLREWIIDTLPSAIQWRINTAIEASI